VKNLKKAALNLSSAETYTPVSYWLSQPVNEMLDWIEIVTTARRRK